MEILGSGLVQSDGKEKHNAAKYYCHNSDNPGKNKDGAKGADEQKQPKNQSNDAIDHHQFFGGARFKQPQGNKQLNSPDYQRPYSDDDAENFETEPGIEYND